MKWSLLVRPGGLGRRSEVLVLDGDGTVLLTDTGFLAAIERRQELAKRLAPVLATKLGVAVSAEYLEAQVETAWCAAVGEKVRQEAAPPPLEGRPDRAELLRDMSALAREEAAVLLEDPALIGRVTADVALLGVAGEVQLAQALYLVGTSRLLDNPASARVFGPTASGKSYVVDKVAELFPPEARLMATSVTPQALYYMKPGELEHRFVIAGERSRGPADEVAEGTRALREMISSGRLSKWLPIKQRGEIVTVKVEQKGPIAFVESTSLTQIFDEDENRCLPLATDETPEQTRRIIDEVARQYTRPVPAGERLRALDRHHALQRTLEILPVMVPFAQRLGELFAAERVEARRAYPMLLRVVEASALLHQKQRRCDGNGAVVASAEDYIIVRRLLSGPVARLLGAAISPAVRRFLDRLAAWASGNFTTTQARLKEKCSRGAVHGWLAELHAAGLVELVERSHSNAPAVWKRTGLPPEEVSVLPLPGQLFPGSS
jgi:hypothetical protein